MQKRSIYIHNIRFGVQHHWNEGEKEREEEEKKGGKGEIRGNKGE